MAWPIRFIPTDRSRPSYRAEQSGSARSPSCARISNTVHSQSRIRNGRFAPRAVTWHHWGLFFDRRRFCRTFAGAGGRTRLLLEIACAPPPVCQLEEPGACKLSLAKVCSVSQRRRQQFEGLSLHSNGNTSCLPESARIETQRSYVFDAI